MKPDGTVDVGGESFRLVEVARSHFRLERVRDGVAMGELTVPAQGKPQATAVTEEAKRVVDAVAELLETPRGILPLQ